MIVNINRTKKYDVYIGRAGKGLDGYFGNPFPLESFGGDRDACLAAYKTYFLDRVRKDEEFKRRVLALKGKTLGCFCAPDLCHGEVIEEWLGPVTVAFTGHRPDKLGGYGLDNPTRDRVLRALLATLRDVRPARALSGMALGVDQWAALCCVHLGIPFEAVIPFKGQEKMWPEASQREYRRILTLAAGETYSPCIGDVNADLQSRNEYMVDHCDVLIAVWDGSRGGTHNCVKYAEQVGRRIIRIDPRKLK